MSLLFHTRLVSTSAYCSLSDTSRVLGDDWVVLVPSAFANLLVSPGLALQMYSQMSARGDGMKDE